MMNFEEDIRQCIKVLREGGVILYPTDTIWGLGCDATRPESIDKVFRIKARPENKSMIVLVNGYPMLERYVKEIPDAANQILNVTDKPITIIYPACKNLAPNALAQDGSAGIRIAEDPFCQELITRFRKPIISTSANISGEPAPAFFDEVSAAINSSVDYVVKHRQDDRQKRTPSPVIKIELNGEIKIIRN